MKPIVLTLEKMVGKRESRPRLKKSSLCLSLVEVSGYRLLHPNEERNYFPTLADIAESTRQYLYSVKKELLKKSKGYSNQRKY
jgi:hypothetical protein